VGVVLPEKWSLPLPLDQDPVRAGAGPLAPCLLRLVSPGCPLWWRQPGLAALEGQGRVETVNPQDWDPRVDASCPQHAAWGLSPTLSMRQAGRGPAIYTHVGVSGEEANEDSRPSARCGVSSGRVGEGSLPLPDTPSRQQQVALTKSPLTLPLPPPPLDIVIAIKMGALGWHVGESAGCQRPLPAGPASVLLLPPGCISHSV
jgi:hypothetical protein